MGLPSLFCRLNRNPQQCALYLEGTKKLIRCIGHSKLGEYGGLILLDFVLSWPDCIYEKVQIHSNKWAKEKEVPTNIQYEIFSYETFVLILCNGRCSSTYFCLIGSWCSSPDLHKQNNQLDYKTKSTVKNLNYKGIPREFSTFLGPKNLV